MASEQNRLEYYAKVNTVRDLIDLAAERYGDKPFIKYLEGDGITEKSFSELRSNSLALSRYIRSICPRRMHIAVIGKTTYEYITALTGTLVSGNVFVPFAPNISVREACELFADGDVEALFYEADFDERAKEIAEKCPQLKTVVNMGDAEHFASIYSEYGEGSEYAPLSEVELDPDDCAAIIYTSGTTGVRKGVMLSSRNLISNVTYTELALDPNDVMLSVLPMHHIFCISCDYFKPLLDGITVCLNGEISNIGRSLATFKPTTMRAVPMICDTLIKKVHMLHKKYPELTDRQAAELVFGENFKWIAVGGAALGKGLVADYEKHGIMLRQGYGMTEVSPKISTADFGDECKDSSGKILRSIGDVRIVDGEIQVKGSSVMMGYYKKPEETAKVFTEDGYLKTGDLGRITSSDHIYVTGRLKNLIILSNGENVSPEMLENKFADEKVVKEIVVYGDKDRIVAEIFPDAEYASAAGIDDIKGYLESKAEQLNESEPEERRIAEIRLRDKPFEKTTTGKIKRTAVKIEY